MVIEVDSTVKSDLKESDEESQGNSLSHLMASARKTLFKSTPANWDEQKVNSTQSRKWVPIRKTQEAKNGSRASNSSWKGAITIAGGTTFNVTEATPTKKTSKRNSNEDK
jgi:hypothetical protein